MDPLWQNFLDRRMAAIKTHHQYACPSLEFFNLLRAFFYISSIATKHSYEGVNHIDITWMYTQRPKVTPHIDQFALYFKMRFKEIYLSKGLLEVFWPKYNVFLGNYLQFCILNLKRSQAKQCIYIFCYQKCVQDSDTNLENFSSCIRQPENRQTEFKRCIIYRYIINAYSLDIS